MSSISFDVLAKLIIVLALALFCLAIVFIRFAVKTVPENKRVIVFRLGKSLGSRGPGIVTIVPGIDTAIWVDVQRTYRYRYTDLPTSDDQKMSFVITLEGKVVDPEKSVVNVPNLENALSKAIEAEIVELTRSKKSDELVDLGGWIEGRLKDVLYRAGRSWGFDVIELVVNDIRAICV